MFLEMPDPTPDFQDASRTEARMQARRNTLLSLLLAVIVLSFSLGCASDRHAASIPSAPTPDAGSALAFVPLPHGSMAVPQASSNSASKAITAAAGGEIAVSGMRVRFPAGSLPSNQTITLVVDVTERVLISLQPAGIALRSPAIIQLDNLRKTDGTGYQGLSFYQITASGTAAQPTSNDWRTPQAWVLTTGDFFLGGTRWDIPGMQFIRYLSGDGYVTQLVTPAGGKVTCDRIKLTFPPGALRLDTFITVHQTSQDGALVAVLEPHGIQFYSAVTLEINLTGLDWQPYTDWSIYWLNDATDSWVNQGGSFGSGKVTGSLWHFSTYAPARGRAGW
jgi:hypothetical protein